MKTLMLAGVLALGLASNAVGGEDLPRVRVQTAEGRITGALIAIREGEVVLREPRWEGREAQAPAAIPVRDVERLEVQMGVKTEKGKGRLLGAAFGLVLGLGWAHNQKDGLAAGLLGGILLFSGGGFVIGGEIGERSKREAWEAIPLDKAPVSGKPAEKGVEGTMRR